MIMEARAKNESTTTSGKLHRVRQRRLLRLAFQCSPDWTGLDGSQENTSLDSLRC